MRSGVVKQSWLEHSPERGWDARFWLDVAEQMKGLEDTPDNVTAAIGAVDLAEAGDRAEAQLKREAAKDLVEEARTLERKWA